MRCAEALREWILTAPLTVLLTEPLAYLTLLNAALVLMCVVFRGVRAVRFLYTHVVDLVASSTFVLIASFALVPWRRLHLNMTGLRCTWTDPRSIALVHACLHVLPLVAAAWLYGRAYNALNARRLAFTFAAIGLHALCVDHARRYYDAATHENAKDARAQLMYLKGLAVWASTVALAVLYSRVLRATDAQLQAIARRKKTVYT